MKLRVLVVGLCLVIVVLIAYFSAYRGVATVRQGNLLGFKSGTPRLPASSQEIIQKAHDQRDFQSQQLEEKEVYQKYFAAMEAPGVFVEFGARDGIAHSATWFFAKHLGWRGLLVDPDPVENRALVRNRHESITVNGCICPHGETRNFTIHKYPGWSGVADEMHPRRKDHFATKASRQVQVQCFSLTNLLAEAGIHHVHYMVADTEGSELNALKTFPWETTTVELLSVETLRFNKADESGQENQDAIMAFMAQQGYENVRRKTIAADTVNFWFSPKRTVDTPPVVLDPVKFETARRKYQHIF